MSPKNSNDTIGNRTRDLPVCSVVPQPLRYGAPRSYFRAYLNMTPFSQTTERRTVELLVNKNIKGCGKKSLSSNLRYVLSTFSERLRNTTDILVTIILRKWIWIRDPSPCQIRSRNATHLITTFGRCPDETSQYTKILYKTYIIQSYTTFILLDYLSLQFQLLVSAQL